MRPFYRVWQFWQVVTARPLDETVKEEIEAVLSTDQLRLFGRFSVSEQQHGYRVFSTLRDGGHDDPDLLAAALLHDVGKTVKPRFLWDKVLVVLGQAFLAGKAAEWAEGEATGFKRPFVVKARHADWGADAAEAALSSPTTVALIRHHHEQPGALDDELNRYLPLLQWADDNS